MGKQDVWSEQDGAYISRMGAALTAAADFTQGQLQPTYAAPTDALSLIVFSEGATTMVDRQALTHQLPKRIRDLEGEVTPRWGTSYRIGLQVRGVPAAAAVDDELSSPQQGQQGVLPRGWARSTNATAPARSPLLFAELAQEALNRCDPRCISADATCLVFLSDGRPGDVHFSAKTEVHMYGLLDALRRT